MLGGDFNVGHVDWENYLIKAEHQKQQEIIADNVLTQHQIEPTRLDRKLDLFPTN